mmetsp:Transcript_84385/g.220377  ORF Transcript_84385/g.220377 Transcript_84385/m.220377 type:complete len:215 (+) Transcript_84385:1295-1939(+)
MQTSDTVSRLCRGRPAWRKLAALAGSVVLHGHAGGPPDTLGLALVDRPDVVEGEALRASCTGRVLEDARPVRCTGGGRDGVCELEAGELAPQALDARRLRAFNDRLVPDLARRSVALVFDARASSVPLAQVCAVLQRRHPLVEVEVLFGRHSVADAPASAVHVPMQELEAGGGGRSSGQICQLCRLRWFCQLCRLCLLVICGAAELEPLRKGHC